MMNSKDFSISVNKKNNECIITDVTHNEYEVHAILMDANHKANLIKTITSFVSGEIRSIDFIGRVWSDGDYEEPSTDIYIAVHKSNGMLSDFICDLERLITHIYNQNVNLYRLRVETHVF